MSWPVVLGAAAAAFLLALGSVLWSHAGAAVFIEAAVSGLANCF